MRDLRELDIRNLQKMVRLERPRFLSLLSLLSFIGGLFSIRTAIKKLFFSDDIDSAENAINFSINSNGEIPSFIQETINGIIDYWLAEQEYTMIIQSSTLLLSIFSLLGVYLMYKLKKKGFLIYMISNLLMVIIPYIYYFNNTIGQLYVSIQFFITAMFIFLYASQLKYMNA